MSKTSLKTTEEWKHLNWRKLERRVYKLQKRIYRASQRGDVKVVRRLQKTLIKSWSARATSVRRVTQDNQGKKTAGVDGVKSLTPKQRLRLTGELRLGSKARPTRRVWIDKPGKDEKRPLGIPTMKDRALQALVKAGLEPEWEWKFEPNSYGFRPGRSCHDAAQAIFDQIRYKPKFVLDADIAKCFDRINHERLLEKLNTYPTLRRQIRAWLKAGVMDGIELFPTSEGTPQGGVISPLLANITLHGMEIHIGQTFPTLEKRSRETWFHKKGTRFNSPSVIRYADDFVILHEDITVVQRCREIISEWLNDMGLELKPSKTRIAHTLNRYGQEEPGFDFLGFNIRQYEVGKYNSGKNTHGKLLGFKTIIKPSNKAILTHYRKLVDIIDPHKSAPQAALIKHLNPVIRGWSMYYSKVVSSEAFSKLDDLLYWKLRRWAKRRHSNKTGKWVSNPYWQSIDGNNWVFASMKGNNPMALQKHQPKEEKDKKKGKTNNGKTKYYVKVRGEASPYDGNLVYWSSRMGKHPEAPKRVATLLKRQEGKCAHCGLHFREKDVLEIDPITPKSKGGKGEYRNLQLLHRHCHDEKTARDGSPKGTRDKSQVIEEPCEVKVSRTVLKTSRGGDSLA